MSSRTAQRAFPPADLDKHGTAAAMIASRNREAFDKGAESALMKAASAFRAEGDYQMYNRLRDMAATWRKMC